MECGSAECGIDKEECNLYGVGKTGSIKIWRVEKEQKRIGRISAVNSVDCIISIKKPLTLPFFISTLHTNKYV